MNRFILLSSGLLVNIDDIVFVKPSSIIAKTATISISQADYTELISKLEKALGSVTS